MDPNQQPQYAPQPQYDQQQQYQQQQPYSPQSQQQQPYSPQSQQYQQPQPQYVQAPPQQQTIVVVQQVAAQPTGPTRYQLEVSKSMCSDLCSDTPSCCGALCFGRYTLASLSYRMGRGFCIAWCFPCYVECCIYDEMQQMLGVESEGLCVLFLKSWWCGCCVLNRHSIAWHHYTLAGMPKHTTRIRIRGGVAM